ncbi:PREDICTED: keratin-associated protein 5-6-like [Tauraco erythrolophus]|uniref:keratin-associated protein 5-6-like n=1 Tax=Tauraco erythrolophus TaxID=121530 RepID=UPI0005234E7A|nr:PREDICTED: keratin-associated protein 5-6-like [Tauraco erythrolophus]
MPNGCCGCGGGNNYSVCCYSTRKSCCKTPMCCAPTQCCYPTTCCIFAYTPTDNMPNGCCGCGGGNNYTVCCYSSPKGYRTPMCCAPTQCCYPTACCMPMQACCYTISNNNNNGWGGGGTGGCCGN